MLDNFKNQYKLRKHATHDEWVYIKARKRMYSLPQAELLEQELLEQQLVARWCTQSKLTPGLWKDYTNPIQFCHVVDDFGVQYMGRENTEHLKQVLEYEMSTSWNWTKYIRLTFEWNYSKHEVHLSMPGYVQKSLTRFKHPQPQKLPNQLYAHALPKYGQERQLVELEKTAPNLNKMEKNVCKKSLEHFCFTL